MNIQGKFYIHKMHFIRKSLRLYNMASDQVHKLTEEKKNHSLNKISKVLFFLFLSTCNYLPLELFLT